jgi:hypothetical protein
MHDGERKFFRHDTHDGVHGVGEADGSPEDPGVAVKLPQPLTVCKDEDRRGSWTLVVVEQGTPEDRLDPRQTQSRGRDRSDPNQLHASVTGDEVAFIVAEGT